MNLQIEVSDRTPLLLRKAEKMPTYEIIATARHDGPTGTQQPTSHMTRLDTGGWDQDPDSQPD